MIAIEAWLNKVKYFIEATATTGSLIKTLKSVSSGFEIFINEKLKPCAVKILSKVLKSTP